jgi:hypothetical protein
VTAKRPTDPQVASAELPLGPRVVRVIKKAYAARLAVLLEGPTGIGKSELLLQVAAELGIEPRVMDLSLMEAQDLQGLPYRRGDVTYYAPPNLLPRSGAGLLIFEELGRSEPMVQNPALQLMTARRLNEYVLPDGWSVCAATNPAGSDYRVAPLDPALQARFLTLKVYADTAAWLLWAERNAMHPSILRLARLHDRMLHDVPPRTWAYVSRILSVLEDKELQDRERMDDLLVGYLKTPWRQMLLEAAWPHEEKLDPAQLLSRLHIEPDLRGKLRKLRRAGRTDRLEQLYRLVHAALSGNDLEKLAAEGTLSLRAFEVLCQELPGDMREGLEEAFADNPSAARLLEVSPEDVLSGYLRTPTRSKLRAWLGKRPLGYRVRTLEIAILRLLESSPDPDVLRQDPAVLLGLGHFVEEVGPERCPRLLEALERLRIELNG